MTQSDQLPAAGRNQGRQPKDGPDLIMQSAQSPKFFDDWESVKIRNVPANHKFPKQENFKHEVQDARAKYYR